MGGIVDLIRASVSALLNYRKRRYQLDDDGFAVFHYTDHGLFSHTGPNIQPNFSINCKKGPGLPTQIAYLFNLRTICSQIIHQRYYCIFLRASNH